MSRAIFVPVSAWPLPRARCPPPTAAAKGLRRNSRPGKKYILAKAMGLGLLIGLLMPLAVPAAGVKLRDLVMVFGARDNQLVGYGRWRAWRAAAT